MDSWDETMKRAKGKFMFSAIILLRCLLLCVADLDAITKDKPIRDGQLLTSKEEKFALGFFTPETIQSLTNLEFSPSTQMET